jgi:hypothetical protein
MVYTKREVIMTNDSRNAIAEYQENMRIEKRLNKLEERINCIEEASKQARKARKIKMSVKK